MKGRFGSLAIRSKINLPSGIPPDAVLFLLVNYDEGFIAWLGGKEFARRNIAADGPVPLELTWRGSGRR